MIRTVIADDHELIRDGFKKLILSEDDIELAGEAETAAELMEILSEQTVDVAILDLHLPDRDGMDVLKDLRFSKAADVKVLILSMYPEERFAARALKNGAAGYLAKDSASEELIKAIRSIYSRGKYITPRLAEILADTIQNGTTARPHEKLSDREYQVLLSIGRGRTVSETAAELCLSVNTVNSYRRRLLEKLDLHSTTDCIRYVFEHHLND